MKAVSTSGQRKMAAEAATGNPLRVSKATATVPLAEMRETLAEANENIKFLEKAIITAKQIEEAEYLRYKPFFAACSKGDEPTARALLATGLNVNWHTNQGVTALHLAAANGYVAVARLLLEQGAEVDSRMGELDALRTKIGISFVGATPWLLAKANKRGATAELLFSYGADPNATMGNGITWQAALEAISKVGAMSMNVS